MRKQVISYIIFLILFCSNEAKAQILPDQNLWYYIKLDGQLEVLTLHEHYDAKVVTEKQRLGDKTQQWRFIRVSETENLYLIINRKQVKYLDVPYGRKNIGETIFCHENKGGENQQFYLIKGSNGLFYISPKCSGLSLTMKRNIEDYCLYRKEDYDFGPATTVPVGTKCGTSVEANYVKQMGLTGDRAQKWTLVKVIESVEIKTMNKYSF